MSRHFVSQLKRRMPKGVLAFVRPPYHFMLALIGAMLYRFPSRKITVIAITGTKGKSSVAEIVNALFEAAGARTALLSTIRFQIGEKKMRNMYKMTMPGRFFVHRFLRDAVDARCDVAIVEMTSEGVKQFRHKWVAIDTLVFTNLSPEHIESHGSYEKYLAAKLQLARALEQSPKRPRTIVANADDEQGAKFLAAKVERRIPFSLKDAAPYTLNADNIAFMLNGTLVHVPLVGEFNLANVLAAVAVARAHGIEDRVIIRALEKLEPIRGRVERLTSHKHASKRITAIVDYAHTPDSLEKLYKAFPRTYKVCVLGNTGGGRDTWKRPEMGRIADKYCEQIILTNEDPYDEDPRAIVEEMRAGIEHETKLDIIMDREHAIRTAIERAPDGAVVLITGKGTDPYIMGPNGTKQPWSDVKIVQSALDALR